MERSGVAAWLALEARVPLSPLTSGDVNDLGRAVCEKVVHKCDADVDFRSLQVGISCADPLSTVFETAHIRDDQALA